MKRLLAPAVAFALTAVLGAIPATPASAVGSMRTLAVNSASKFCSFLPPKPGQDIASSEESAIAFCTDPTLAPGAKKFPAGFIVSAHFVRTSTYVQVTGRIDRTKYKLKASDGGGQYDPRAPVGASVIGWALFVNIVEPDSNLFCIRAGNNPLDIKLNMSAQGCEVVVPGNYS